jgi:hypothetical protein
MSFIRQASIKGGFSDLLVFMRQGGKMRPLVMLAACVPTTAIVTMFYLDSMNKATPPPPTVTYFESWPADRSVEESLAANREYQKTKDAMRAREVEAYKALGRAVGMDVDKLDAEAQIDAAKKRAQTEADIAARVGASK